MNIFTVNSDIHGHNTRRLNDVHLPKVKTDIVKRSYLICKAPVYWSQLSNNVKSSKTNNIFKIISCHNTKQYYLDVYSIHACNHLLSMLVITYYLNV